MTFEQGDIIFIHHCLYDLIDSISGSHKMAQPLTAEQHSKLSASLHNLNHDTLVTYLQRICKEHPQVGQLLFNELSSVHDKDPSSASPGMRELANKPSDQDRKISENCNGDTAPPANVASSVEEDKSTNSSSSTMAAA